MSRLIIALASTLTLAGLITLGRAVFGGDSLDEGAAWKVYEEEAKKAGAGESVPTPDEKAFGRPWLKRCYASDGWCPSILEGTIAGEKWCASDKCSTRHRTQSYDIFMDWGPWIDDCGGQPGLWPAQTCRTESHVGESAKNPVFAKTKSGTKECGLASVDRDHAEGLDINACDPRANLWATCWYRNNRLIKLRELVPEITRYPLEQQWLIAGAGGAVGLGKVIALLKMSGALTKNKDGEPKHAKPHRHLVQYMKGLHHRWKRARAVKMDVAKIGRTAALAKHGLTEKQWKWLEPHADLYTSHGQWASMFGWRPGRTAFRITRPAAALRIIRELYPEGRVPWSEPALPPRPAGILPYPGKKLHCACGNWKHLQDDKPTLLEIDAWLESLDGDKPLHPDDV